jgi:hypothetical protein
LAGAVEHTTDAVLQAVVAIGAAASTAITATTAGAEQAAATATIVTDALAATLLGPAEAIEDAVRRWATTR